MEGTKTDERTETAGTATDGRAAETTDGTGSGSSNRTSSKTADYIENIRKRSAERAGSDSTGADQRAENGRNVRSDGAGEGGNDRGTGAIRNESISNGRDSGTANPGSGRGRKGNGGTSSARATNDAGLTIVVPAAAKDDKKKGKASAVAVVLTDKEAKEMQSDFVGFLRILFEWMDDAISFTNKDHAEAYIWKGIDNEDAGKIATAILSLAKRRSSIAVAVRAISNSYVYYEAGLISSQKVIETFLFYRNHHGFSIPGIM